MAGYLIALALAVWSALCFGAGGWHLRYRAYRHQIRATRTAISDPRLLADALAWHRRQLPRLHLPHLRIRGAR